MVSPLTAALRRYCLLSFSLELPRCTTTIILPSSVFCLSLAFFLVFLVSLCMCVLVGETYWHTSAWHHHSLPLLHQHDLLHRHSSSLRLLHIPAFFLPFHTSSHTHTLNTNTYGFCPSVSLVRRMSTMPSITWSTPLVMNQLMSITKLPVEMQKAATAAVAAHVNSYSPYTNFRVGAALLHEDGNVTSGCNYENCTLQACCAERCAIVRANAEGRRCANAVAVYGRGYMPSAVANPPPSDALCTPCGLCRQLLVEVADLSQNFEEFIIILVAHDTTRAKLVRLADFLPGKFGPSNIGMDVAALAKITQ